MSRLLLRARGKFRRRGANLVWRPLSRNHPPRPNVRAAYNTEKRCRASADRLERSAVPLRRRTVRVRSPSLWKSTRQESADFRLIPRRRDYHGVLRASLPCAPRMRIRTARTSARRRGLGRGTGMRRSPDKKSCLAFRTTGVSGTAGKEPKVLIRRRSKQYVRRFELAHRTVAP
jgi:hypothetical protein